jgi:hypothetical protein
MKCLCCSREPFEREVGNLACMSSIKRKESAGKEIGLPVGGVDGSSVDTRRKS